MRTTTYYTRVIDPSQKEGFRIDETTADVGFKTQCNSCFNIEELIEERRIARHNKDFKRSDEIRNILDQLLVFVFDTKEGMEIYHLTPLDGH